MKTSAKKKILIITDNEFLYRKISKLFGDKLNNIAFVEFNYSYNNLDFNKKNISSIRPINLKTDWRSVVKKYDLVISAHCKQLFPKESDQEIGLRIDGIIKMLTGGELAGGVTEDNIYKRLREDSIKERSTDPTSI